MAAAKKPKKKPVAKEPVAPAITERRYFERGDRFFELWLEGELRLRTRTGKLGSDGQTKQRDFEAGYEAKRELRKLVEQKTRDGFAQRIAGATPAPAHTNPDLERAIVANPYDDDAYLVYADWLQGQGDPRGELIALMRASAKRGKKFLDAHAATFLGPLVQHQLCYDGFGDGKHPAFTWKNGFIVGARLAHNCYATEWKGKLAYDVLAPLLAHPSGRFLAELVINENDDPTDDSIEDLLDVLAEQPRPTLRKIRIGDDISQLSWYQPGKLGKLWAAAPNLTHFELEAGMFELGTIHAPHLVRAVIKTGGLSKAAARSIAKAHWPNLEHLEVYFGDSQYGGNTTIKDAQAIIHRTDLPKLRYLGVKDAEYQDEIVEVIATSKVLRQLETLDLAYGILSDAAVDTFLKHAAAFRHLKHLNLSTTYLTKAGAKRLKGVAKSINVDHIRGGDKYDTDPSRRYVWVGE